MLKIQKFILDHQENWRELLSNPPYSLRISETDNYVLLKYSQIDSDFNEGIVNECRGIIFEKETWQVVRLAFYKFFNYQEQYAAPIDWESSYATEKIDGSLISVWFHNGIWHISTNGGINAYDAPLGTNVYSNFGQLFEVAALNSNFSYDELNPNYCYTYELVSPYNKVVVNYPKPQLYHILTRDMQTLEEVDVDTKVPKPAKYYSKDILNYIDTVEKFDSNHEGIVVVDKNFNRVKIKTQLYFQLHKIRNNGVVYLEEVLDMVRANDYEEFLGYFPEYREYFEKVQQAYFNIVDRAEEIQSQVDEWKKENIMKGISDSDLIILRKEFAKKFNKSLYKSLYFLAYDNKLNYRDWDSKKIIKLFRIEIL